MLVINVGLLNLGFRLRRLRHHTRPRRRSRRWLRSTRGRLREALFPSSDKPRPAFVCGKHVWFPVHLLSRIVHEPDEGIVIDPRHHVFAAILDAECLVGAIADHGVAHLMVRSDASPAVGSPARADPLALHGWATARDIGAEMFLAHFARESGCLKFYVARAHNLVYPRRSYFNWAKGFYGCHAIELILIADQVILASAP